MTFINSSLELKIENKSIICFVKLYPVTSFTDYGTVIQFHVATLDDIYNVLSYMRKWNTKALSRLIHFCHKIIHKNKIIMSLYQYFQPLRHFSVRQYILLHVLSYDCRLNATESRRTNLIKVF